MEHSQEVVDQFIEMRSQGMTFQDIQKNLGVSKPTLIEWSRRYHKTITNFQTMEMVEVSQKNYLEKKKRVELLGGTLNKIQEELSKRDLSTVPTEKLMKFQLECAELLKREETPLTFQGEEDANPLCNMLPVREMSWAV